MANKFKILRGSGAPASLEAGELAYDLANEILRIGDGSGIDKIAGKGAVVMLEGDQSIAGVKTFTDVISGSIDGNAATADEADKLSTSRTISASGDATGSASFDGSANTDIALTLADSGVSVGTHTKVTVDSKGRVTVGGNLVASDIPSLQASKISNFDSQVRTSRLDQMAAPTSSVNLNSQKIVSLADPSAVTDAANKGYVDSSVSAEASARTSAISAETAARTAADTALGGRIDTEIADRTAAVSAEASARTAAIAAEASARTSAIAAETSARESAVTTLTDRISNVESNVDPAALDSLTEVVEAFQAADSNLNGAITTLANSASSALEAAVEDLEAADSELGVRIDGVQADLADYEGEANGRLSSVEARVTGTENDFVNLSGRVNTLENTVAGLGDLSTQNASSVSITGGSISNVTVSSAVIDCGTY